MVPMGSGRIKEFRFSIAFIVLILTIVALGYLSVFLSVKGIRPFHIEKNELSFLREQNRQLATQVAELTKKTILLRKSMEQLANKEKAIRALAEMAEDSTGRRLPNTQKPLPINRSVSLTAIDSSMNQTRRLLHAYDSVLSSLAENNGVIDYSPTLRPVAKEAYLSSRFGFRKDPFTGEVKPHLGVDFSSEVGTPVFAAAAGTVIFSGKDKGFGNVIRINHRNGFETFYAHLNNMTVHRGQVIKKGQSIGTLGSTGRSIGPHLYYEIRFNDAPVDPEDYF